MGPGLGLLQTKWEKDCPSPGPFPGPHLVPALARIGSGPALAWTPSRPCPNVRPCPGRSPKQDLATPSDAALSRACPEALLFFLSRSYFFVALLFFLSRSYFFLSRSYFFVALRLCETKRFKKNKRSGHPRRPEALQKKWKRFKRNGSASKK